MDGLRLFRYLRQLLDIGSQPPWTPGDVFTVQPDGETVMPETPTAGGVTDHGALTGLADDDHPQYLKEKASGGAASEIPVHTHASGAEAGTLDHGALTGLADNDHPQYQLAASAATDAELAAHIAADVVDGDAAGGVLGGTYPNPSFAADMATQAELDAHLNDASDAHDASGISFTPAGTIAATDVQAAIEEVATEAGSGGAPTTADYLVGTAQGGLSAEIVVGTTPGGELGNTWASPTVDATHSGSSHAGVQAAAEATAAAALAAHVTDASDAHDASAVSVDSTTLSGTGTDVQASLEEIDNLLDDHSARHENGGADEISIAGLDGTPVELTNHLSDASDAHDASAISVVSTTLSGTGTDAQAVFEELDNLLDDHSARHENGGADEISIAGLDGTSTELAAHLADATDAHDASAISIVDAANDFTATEVEGALAELQTADEADEAALAAHLADTTDAHDASAISSVAAGNLVATDVQAALNELDTEKQPLDADLTTIAGLADPNADRILFWDDSAGAYTFLTPGTNLTITGTTIDASGGSSVAADDENLVLHMGVLGG